jgi:ATP-dependent metalloprotease
MVTSYGMSPELGNVDLASNHDKLSADTKRMIESEVRRMIEEGYVRARELLQLKRKELDLLAKALIDYETLNKDEAFKVVKGEKLEGKIIMPSGPMKVPGFSGPSLPEIPPIPGSASQGETGGKEPPAGGAVA